MRSNSQTNSFGSGSMKMSPPTRLAYDRNRRMDLPKFDIATGTNRRPKTEPGIGGLEPTAPTKEPIKQGQAQNLVLSARNGNNTLSGGDGNDTLISYSDAGEPSVLGKQVVNQNEPLKNSNDTLIGGKGADTFLFALELDGKPEFLTKHTQADGRINGEGLAGENNSSHNHWLESIGNDTIVDFNLEQGDKIDIKGHTVDLFAIDKQGSDYVLRLRANQGNADQNKPNGAHDGDLVGTITVKGAADKYTPEQLKSAIKVDNTVHYVAEGRGVETLKTEPASGGVVGSTPTNNPVKADSLLGSGTTTGVVANRDITNIQKTPTVPGIPQGDSNIDGFGIVTPAGNGMYGILGQDLMMSFGTSKYSGIDFSNLNPDSLASQLGSILGNNSNMLS